MQQKCRINILKFKVLGGVGAIIQSIPLFVVPFIGFAMVTTSIYKIAKLTKKPEIFKNYLTALVLSLATTCSVLGSFILTATGHFYAELGGIFGLVLSYAMSVVQSVFIRKTLYGLSEVTGVDLFKVAGNVIFTGFILTVILIGFLLMFAGYILLVISFFMSPNEMEVEC